MVRSILMTEAACRTILFHASRVVAHWTCSTKDLTSTCCSRVQPERVHISAHSPETLDTYCSILLMVAGQRKTRTPKNLAHLTARTNTGYLNQIPIGSGKLITCV